LENDTDNLQASMNRADLDRLQKSRLAPVRKAWSDSYELIVPDVFASQRVVENLPEDKAILPAFRMNAVLSLLPFVKNLYVIICPKCVSAEYVDGFSQLTSAGLIVPIFTAPYSKYPESVVSAVAGADHISTYEYHFYRLAYSVGESRKSICPHCVKLRHDEFKRVASELKIPGFKSEYVDWTISNLHPFTEPDDKFIDDLGTALKSGQLDRVKRLYDLSFAVHNVRLAKAFNASQIVRDSELLSIPYSTVPEFDESRTGLIRLTSLAAEGLKIRLPTDLPIQQYIELVQDYRPKILGLTQQLLIAPSNESNSSEHSLLETITSINRDIERVKGSRRYMFVEALVGFVRNNPALVSSALIAGALGLTGSIAGCLSVPIGIGADILKKAGKLKANDAAKRLGRKLRRDLQPSVDKLIARYVGSTTTAMHVLSIREDVANASNSTAGVERAAHVKKKPRSKKKPNA
jgi:hypothetical protein